MVVPSPSPSPSPQTQERIIERDRLVPVPQTVAPPPDVNITVPSDPQAPAAQTAPSTTQTQTAPSTQSAPSDTGPIPSDTTGQTSGLGQ